MNESLVIEVCAVVTNGMLHRDAIVQLSSVDDEAVGEIVVTSAQL